MKKWADILFPHPPHQRFTYAVPENMRDALSIGQRVIVSLGRRKCTGFLVDWVPRPEIEDVRDIEDIVDPYPLLSTELLELTKWVSEYYLCPWGEVIRAALPPGLRRRNRMIVQLEDDVSIPENPLTEVQQAIIDFLHSKRVASLRSLQKHAGSANIRHVLN